MTFNCLFVSLFIQTILPGAEPATTAEPTVPDDAVMQAMTDELQRSMEELELQDLPRPYFVQFRADDRYIFTARAKYGGLTHSDIRHSRAFRSRVRVGSYELDNTNVGGGGAGASLPLDDDYTALRHAIWAAVDGDYKRAVEILARKQAYLRDKNIKDPPPDFSPAPMVQEMDPIMTLSIDRDNWEELLKKLSARIAEYPEIIESDVSMFAGTSNEYLVNSEGSRLRIGDTGALLTIDAALQAPDGMWLRDQRSFLAETAKKLPDAEELLAGVDGLCKDLMALSQAPMAEHYLGPVLFEPQAAGRMFASLLGGALCARPSPLGRRTPPGDSLESRLGLRVLPRSFQVYDDPRDLRFDGKLLAGAYKYDDEAVLARRVNLIEDGILKDMLAGRAPTKKISGSNGHGRSAGLGDARARVGCLYVVDGAGVPPEALKKGLIEAAREEGLEYGLRVKSLEKGGRGSPGKPIYAYKVYAEDDREELVRGLEFLPVETRALKRILAGGSQQEVYNDATSIVTSYITPAVLLEELELAKQQEEFDKRPLLDAPAVRQHPSRGL